SAVRNFHRDPVPACHLAHDPYWSRAASTREPKLPWSSVCDCATISSTTSATSIIVRAASENHHAADALTAMHQVEGLVDVGERHGVGDHRVDLDLAVHVPVDDLRHVGAAPGAAEGGALPHAARHKLKRPRRDLGARRRDTDDDRYAPAAMAGFER